MRSRRAAPLLLVALAAAAHDFPHPKQDLLRLSPAGISILVDYLVAPGAPSRTLRAAFSGNRAALLQHLARTAALRTRLTVDGVEVALAPQPPRGEGLDEPPSSTALLAVRLELLGSWPAGSGDWRGRRKVLLADEDANGHVAPSAACRGCRIADASSGAWEKAPGEERVLGAQTPLMLLVRLP